jgi:uncharacterized repeat protein (TIGR01451 family)
LRANERIDWSIARNGIGQFTEMGIRDPSQLLGWWEAPQKIDDWTAAGTTAFVPISLNAGTDSPADDVQIQRGETWVTLTSPCEGTSLVTAYAPGLSAFNQATTSVYWIDAQWIFPASAVAECGRPHVLTTTIMRRSDGAPLAGWIVRYNVGSGASLGYEGGNATDVPTDASGRASVEVSPTEAGGGMATVGITIIRPESAGSNALPRVELARGAATITWSAVGAPAVPAAPAAPMTPAPSLPGQPMTPAPSLPTTPAPFTPPSTTAPAPLPQAQPAPQAPAPYSPPVGQPRLEINLRLTTPDQVAVGEFVSYDLTVTNRGDGVARSIRVRDRFDQGLTNPGDTRNAHVIETSNIRDLQPNESQTVPLTFQVVAPGQQCHEVTVTAEGADEARQRGCVTGMQTALEVKVSGLRSRIVGEVADFNVTIRNIGTSTASQVELRVQYSQEIDPVLDAGAEKLPDGSVLVRLAGSLAPNERRVFRLQGRCRGPSNRACARATVNALGGAESVDEWCLEILPAMSSPPPGAP